jgi:hypothetical protein
MPSLDGIIGTGIARDVLALLERAGLPEGVLRIVAGEAEAAQAVVAAGIDKLFFTGSARAGLTLYRLQAEAGRPAVLELSGRHAAVVMADTALARTARGLVWGKLANGGRNCVSVQLVLVERPLAAALVVALGDALAAAWPAGSGRLPDDELARLGAFVADASARGARIAYAGPDGGLPAVVADVTRGMRVVDEEIRGRSSPLRYWTSPNCRLDQRRQARLSASVWALMPAQAWPRASTSALDVTHSIPPQPTVPWSAAVQRLRRGRGLAGLMGHTAKSYPSCRVCLHWGRPAQATLRGDGAGLAYLRPARFAAVPGCRAIRTPLERA